MGGPSGGPSCGSGVFMGNVAVGAGALVGVGAASDSQANTAMPVATIAVNNIRTLKRLIETPCKIEMCDRPAQ